MKLILCHHHLISEDENNMKYFPWIFCSSKILIEIFQLKIFIKKLVKRHKGCPLPGDQHSNGKQLWGEGWWQSSSDIEWYSWLLDGCRPRLHPHKPARQWDDVAAAAPLRLKVGLASSLAGQHDEFYIPRENNHLLLLPQHFPQSHLTASRVPFNQVILTLSNTF